MRSIPKAGFVLILLSACQREPSRVGAKPPVKAVEVYNTMAVVELMPGVSALDVVGTSLFAGLKPSWTPAEAEQRIGKADSIEKRDGVTRYIYSRQHNRAAIVEQLVAPSGGGPENPTFHLEAFPSEGFGESLPESVRALILARPSLRQVYLASSAPNDWNIQIQLSDGRITGITAYEGAPPEGAQGRGKAAGVGR